MALQDLENIQIQPKNRWTLVGSKFFKKDLKMLQKADQLNMQINLPRERVIGHANANQIRIYMDKARAKNKTYYLARFSKKKNSNFT